MTAIRFGLILGVVLVAGLASPPARGEDSKEFLRIDIALSQRNLKQISLAFYNFHNSSLSMPANLATADGKLLLSWRVVILPYLGEEDLYKQFKLDESWDSVHNRKLIPKIPRVYAPFRVKAKEGETFYQVFTGQKTLFVPGRLTRLPDAIPDGYSNTGLIFEAGDPVIWTKPADLPFDEKKPLPKLGGMFGGECNVVLCDGWVIRLRKNADDEHLTRLIVPNDGDVIDFEKLVK